MKEQVLKTMIAAVDATMTQCKGDFYHWDLQTLAAVSESTPFLWHVGESSTHILCVDYADEKKKLSESETRRFQFMQAPFAHADYFIEMSRCGGLTFYYDGNEIVGIPASKVKSYVKDVFTPMIEGLKKYINANFAGQDGDYKAKVNVHFSTGAFRQVLEIARTSEGAALLKTLRRFRNWARHSHNHQINVFCDFIEKSFYFQEVVDGECAISGGIIYDGHGYWTMHT